MSVRDLPAAQAAIDEYNVAYLAGGELPYPVWAADLLQRYGRIFQTPYNKLMADAPAASMADAHNQTGAA